MTIVYEPRGESHTQEFTNMGDVIDTCKTFNPAEQQQYKTFLFCNMSPSEEHMIKDYLNHRLAIQAGLPKSKIKKISPVPTEMYLAEIGHIKLR